MADPWDVIATTPITAAPPADPWAAPGAPPSGPTPLYSPNPNAPTSIGGATPAEPPSPILDQVGHAINTGVNWAGTQFTKGLTGMAALPTTIQQMGNAAAKIALEKMIGPGHAKAPLPNAMPSWDDMNKYVFGSLGVPEVNAPSIPVNIPGTDRTIDLGKMADAGMQAIPSFGSGGPASLLPAFAGGAASEGAGEATAGTPYEPLARVGGGTAGFMVGGKFTTPLPAKLTPNEARIVSVAKANGVPLTVAQETGRLGGLETGLSRFPTSAASFEKLDVKQSAAANRMALDEIGVKGSRTDPEAMKAAYKTVSDEFNAAKTGGGPVTLTPDTYNKAGRIVEDYKAVTPQSDIVPLVQRKLDDLFDPKLMKGGPYPTLSSEEYQNFRRGLNESMQNMNPGDGAYKAMKGLRNALDDAMEASAAPEAAAAWKSARKHWGNLKVLLRAAAGGTADSRTEGNLAPGALNSALRSAQGADKFATTTGGLNDVAALKDYLKNTFPNSGTPTVSKFHQMMEHGATALAGGLVGGEHLGAISPSVAIPGAAALVAPNLMARAMTGRGFVSKPIRDYLANQAMVGAYPQLYGGVKSLPFSLGPGVALGLLDLAKKR